MTQWEIKIMLKQLGMRGSGIPSDDNIKESDARWTQRRKLFTKTVRSLIQQRMQSASARVL